MTRSRRSRHPGAIVVSLSLVRNGIRSQVLTGVDLQIRPGRDPRAGRRVRIRQERARVEPAGAAAAQRPTRSRRCRHRRRGRHAARAAGAELRRVRRELLGAIFQDPMTSLNPTMRIGRQIGEVTHDDAESVRLLDDRRRPRRRSCACGCTRTNCPAGCGSG